MRNTFLTFISLATCIAHNFNQRYTIPVDYDANAFPDDIVHVDFGFYYGILKFLDPPTASFGVKHILHLMWTDARLGWNATTLEVAVVKRSKVWTPTISLSTASVDNDFDFGGEGPEVRVYSNGTVYWQLSGTSVSMCSINTKYFPYDKQRCVIAFSNTLAPNIILRPMFATAMMPAWQRPNNDWKLIDHRQKLFPNETNDLIVDTNFYDDKRGIIFNANYLIYEFDYQRNSRQLESLWLVPCIFVSFVSNAVYMVPPDGADRLGFLTTITLSMMILLSMISNELPSAPSVEFEPLVTKLYETTLGLFTFQFIVVLFTDRLSQRDDVAPSFMKRPVCTDPRTGELSGLSKNLGKPILNVNVTTEHVLLELQMIRKIIVTNHRDTRCPIRQMNSDLWRTLAWRINLAASLLSTVLVIIMTIVFYQLVAQSNALPFMTE